MKFNKGDIVKVKSNITGRYVKFDFTILDKKKNEAKYLIKRISDGCTYTIEEERIKLKELKTYKSIW